MALRRIQKELVDYRRSTDVEMSRRFVIELPDDFDLIHWKALLFGPEGSPYEGGKFLLSIEFPGDYPFKPPKIVFDTKMYHPQVGARGNISWDVLSDRWSPHYTIVKLLEGLKNILACPDVSDPLVPQIAQVYNEDLKKFEETAREMTKKFAM